MTQLSLALLAALCLTQAPPSDLRIGGLQDGESFSLIAPGPAATADYAHGRVIDAFTGTPLPGATIELWSEEIDDHYGGYHRFGVATSGRDGRFMVRRRDGAQTADKLRASAPGYLVFTESAGAVYDVITLFPAEANAPRLRFVDLQDRPIQGARVTSTYTCAHDIAAFEYTSDVNGVVVLEGYGLQDAIPELRVLAPGFAGIKYLGKDKVDFGWSGLFPDGKLPLGLIPRIKLRRLPGAQLRLFDESGDPLANTVVMVQDGDGHHVVRTDEQGDTSIPARYDVGELTIRRLTPDPGPGAYGHALSQGRTSFRLNGTDWPEETPVGRVRFIWSGEGESEPIEGLQVTHVEGWVNWTDEDGWIELPAGAAYVVPDEADLESPRNTPPIVVIADQSALVSLVRTPLRELCALPAGLVTQVIVEQGAHSTEYFLEETEPFTISAAGSTTCRIHFPEFDESIDCFADKSPLAPELIAATLRMSRDMKTGYRRSAHPEIEWKLSLPEGTEVGVSGQVSQDLDVQQDARELTIQGRVGAELLLQCTGEGRVTRWLRTLFMRAEAAPAIPELSQYAALRFEGPGELEVEGYDDLAELTELHPGPFDCVVRTADGRRIGLQLQLQPGEHRTLRLE